MSLPSAFDQAAVAAAVRRFADLLVVHPRLAAVGRIEVTLCGRGPVERLFAVEAALVAAWPRGLRHLAHDLVADTGEMGASAGLTLRALGPDGAELLRRVYAVDAAKAKRGEATSHVHG